MEQAVNYNGSTLNKKIDSIRKSLKEFTMEVFIDLRVKIRGPGYFCGTGIKRS